MSIESVTIGSDRRVLTPVHQAWKIQEPIVSNEVEVPPEMLAHWMWKRQGPIAVVWVETPLSKLRWG
uniref:Uncharacterized protein n=1 Tax=Hyaloperonospora arabidopsidis (strain Emoy2) TaxID=559515 RepID=M4C334_HYAAE